MPPTEAPGTDPETLGARMHCVRTASAVSRPPEAA